MSRQNKKIVCFEDGVPRWVVSSELLIGTKDPFPVKFTCYNRKEDDDFIETVEYIFNLLSITKSDDRY